MAMKRLYVNLAEHYQLGYYDNFIAFRAVCSEVDRLLRIFSQMHWFVFVRQEAEVVVKQKALLCLRSSAH